MVKIGIYIFTHQIKERKTTKKDFYYDGKAYYGLNYIISELNTENYKLDYVSNANINSVDFVLISITSFYDILNIRKELKGLKIKSKIICGGAGISNIQSLHDIADIIVIGRAEGLINKILDFEELPNVWYKIKDKNLIRKYEIGQPTNLINIKEYKEQNVGCNDKCKFCQYGWKFNIYPQKTDNYNSGYNNREDTIKNLDFSLCNRRTAPRLNSAIDGFTEKTRKIIGKKISNEDITEKFIEIYRQNQSYFALKLYAIVGFSWEKSIDLSEFYDAVNKADKTSDKKLNIFLISTHFVPMPFTPMECEPVNLHNFRNEVEKNNYNKKGKSINIYYPGTQISSPVTAIEQTIINRIKINELNLIDNILLNSKYQNNSYEMKIKIIDKYFKDIYNKKESKDICPEVIRPFKYNNII